MTRPRIPKSENAKAAAIGGAAIMQFLCGIALIAACELRTSSPGTCDKRWDMGILLMFGGTGTGLGLLTRSPLDPPRKRDSLGRYAPTRREEEPTDGK